MKTIKKVIEERPEYKTLVNAVVSRVGKESVKDIINHGIDGGFNGFIYTSDTVAFFRRHKKDIMELAEEMADGIGGDLISMIQGFGCLRDSKLSAWEVSQGLHGDGDAASDVENAMAWFAAEEVCRMFED